MRFQDIPIAALETATVDPRTTPGGVIDSRLVDPPRVLSNSDSPPAYLVFALEGTAGQTLDVTVWALAATKESPFDAPVALTARQFYKVAATVTLTVGGLMKTVPAVRGQIYLQTSVGPAAACVLRMSAMMAALP